MAGDPRRFTTAAIDSALRERPLSFSTSALLRPLLQDQLFPTAAIVGGPGELAYFAELAPLYELFELPMPLCTPRGRFAIVEPRLASQLDEWALCAEDLARPDEELARHFRVDGGEGFAPETIRQRLFEPFANELQRLGSEIAPFDGGVQKTIDKTALHVGDVVDKLARRVEQAWYQADERRLTRLARGRHWLFPGGIPQERVYSWPYFAARFGPRELKRALSESYAPYSALVHDVRP